MKVLSPGADVSTTLKDNSRATTGTNPQLGNEQQREAMAEFQKKYNILYELGKGQDGVVYAAEPRSDTDSGEEDEQSDTETIESPSESSPKQPDSMVAAKITYFDSIYAKNEIDAMQGRLPTSPHLLSLQDYHPSGCWYTLPLVKGPTLFQALKKLNGNYPAGFFWHIFIEFASGLKAIHDRWLAHGDVHAGNVLLDFSDRSYGNYPRLKIIDYSRLLHLGLVKGLDLKGQPITVEQSDLDQQQIIDLCFFGANMHKMVHRHSYSKRDRASGCCRCPSAAVDDEDRIRINTEGIKRCGSAKALAEFLHALRLTGFGSRRKIGEFKVILEYAEEYREKFYKPLPERFFESIEWDAKKARERSTEELSNVLEGLSLGVRPAAPTHRK
ncbi:MAG: hypothetical protein M1828_000703 [Chrysothrix sp. TS-e1954]|nr:MAG: hypothetical protein M1828_000703 [Chrysothrix sp. TS-e1954]